MAVDWVGGVAGVRVAAVTGRVLREWLSERERRVNKEIDQYTVSCHYWGKCLNLLLFLLSNVFAYINEN